MILTDEQREAFNQAAEPLMKWMADNLHPHAKAIVESGTAELCEGVQAHKTGKFFRD